MANLFGASKAGDPEDDVFPVNEMVARVIKALQPTGDGENAPDNGGSAQHQERTEFKKHWNHPTYHGALPLCREWIRPLGFEASILLAYIIEENRLCLGYGMTQDGYFELNEDQIELELCIDKAKFRNIMEELCVRHIVKTRETTDENGGPRFVCRLNPPEARTDLLRRGRAIISGDKNEG